MTSIASIELLFWFCSFLFHLPLTVCWSLQQLRPYIRILNWLKIFDRSKTLQKKWNCIYTLLLVTWPTSINLPCKSSVEICIPKVLKTFANKTVKSNVLRWTNVPGQPVFECRLSGFVPFAFLFSTISLQMTQRKWSGSILVLSSKP